MGAKCRIITLEILFFGQYFLGMVVADGFLNPTSVASRTRSRTHSRGLPGHVTERELGSVPIDLVNRVRVRLRGGGAPFLGSGVGFRSGGDRSAVPVSAVESPNLRAPGSGWWMNGRKDG